MKVIWTHRAILSNNKILDFLALNWSEKVVKSYVSELERTLRILQSNPAAGLYDSVFDSRKILVAKRVYLFYEIDQDRIVIRYLLDAREDRKDLSF